MRYCTYLKPRIYNIYQTEEMHSYKEINSLEKQGDKNVKNYSLDLKSEGHFLGSSSGQRKCTDCDEYVVPHAHSRRPERCSLSCYSTVLQTRSKSPVFYSFSSLSSPLFLIILLSLSTLGLASSITKSECDPTDANSCRYGATCQLQQGRYRHEKPIYKCACPRVSCYNSGLFDPVCGEKENSPKQYFNVLCLMLEECELQQPIKQVCYGMCGEKACKAITPDNLHHARCPREDVSLCLNGGLCVHHTLLKQSSCRCPQGYTGNRCESRMPPTGQVTNPEDDESKCDSKRNILTIFAVVLLAVILLLIVFCLCWRSRRNDKGEDTLLWTSNDTEREETTPLRDSKRTDYLFTESERKGSTK